MTLDGDASDRPAAPAAVSPISRKVALAVTLCILFIATFVSTNEQLLQYSSLGTIRQEQQPVNATLSQQKQEDTERKNNHSPDPSTILQRLLKEKYPECQVLPSSSKIDLATMGAYVPATDPSPPYDQVSCFVMKARYNCAYRPDAPFRMAHQFELVLRLQQQQQDPSTSAASTNSTNNTTTTSTNVKDCRLKALIRDTISEWNKALKEATTTTTTTTSSTLEKNNHGNTRRSKERYHVLLQGNSYVRQLWEALVCSVLSNASSSSSNAGGGMLPVTDFRVQVGGPGISLKDFMARKHRPIQIHELGKSLPNNNTINYKTISDVQAAGCHGEREADISKYFRRKAIVPPNLPYCNDNIAMIEWAHQWRFSYIFKPTMYTPETLDYIYQERLGMGIPTNNDEQHQESLYKWFLVWNPVMKEPQNVTPPILNSNNKSSKMTTVVNIDSWLWTLRDLQLRDLGRYFGANNPWVSKPPDFHACMPGTPDDQVHLLLYLLWSGYRI